MIEFVLFTIFYYGGFFLAIACACIAVRKETELKTARILLIAALILFLAQLGIWQMALKSGNAP